MSLLDETTREEIREMQQVQQRKREEKILQEEKRLRQDEANFIARSCKPSGDSFVDTAISQSNLSDDSKTKAFYGVLSAPSDSDSPMKASDLTYGDSVKINWTDEDDSDADTIGCFKKNFPYEGETLDAIKEMATDLGDTWTEMMERYRQQVRKISAPTQSKNTIPASSNGPPAAPPEAKAHRAVRPASSKKAVQSALIQKKKKRDKGGKHSKTATKSKKKETEGDTHGHQAPPEDSNLGWNADRSSFRK